MRIGNSLTVLAAAAVLSASAANAATTVLHDQDFENPAGFDNMVIALSNDYGVIPLPAAVRMFLWAIGGLVCLAGWRRRRAAAQNWRINEWIGSS